jgi:thiamine thiazole synthase
MKEVEVSKTIIEEYSASLVEHLTNDVIIVGSGPAGLTAAYYLANAGRKVTIIEKRLSTGGGTWGGATGQSVVVFDDNEIINELGINNKKVRSLYTADAIEFAAALAYRAIQAGAKIFNLTEAEDIIVKEKAVEGVVVNQTTIYSSGLPVDPFCIAAKAVIDGTGHPAEVVQMLRNKKSDFHPEALREGFMDVEQAEKMVVEKTGEIHPGLYIAGMAVCATFGLPRMGPIFGGMLKSGKKIAGIIDEDLK